MKVAATALTGGKFVVVWTEYYDKDRAGHLTDDSSAAGVYGQLYDSSGKPIGIPFLVNDITEGNQENPKAIALSDGTFVVTWEGEGDHAKGFGGADLSFQRFDANGNKLGAAQLVDDGTFQVIDPGTGETASFDVFINDSQSTPLADGGFVLTWTHANPDDIFNSQNLYAAVYNADGTVRTEKFLIGTSENSAVTAFDNVGFVVVSEEKTGDNQDESGLGIIVYDAAGKILNFSNLFGLLNL